MKELGARGVWRRPVQRRGWARGRTASASVTNVAARSASSWRLCSSARGLAADSEARIAALWRRRPSASARALDSAVRAAASGRRCSLATTNNVAASWRLRSSASASAADSLARAALWMSSRSMLVRILDVHFVFYSGSCRASFSGIPDILRNFRVSGGTHIGMNQGKGKINLLRNSGFGIPDLEFRIRNSGG